MQPTYNIKHGWVVTYLGRPCGKGAILTGITLSVVDDVLLLLCMTVCLLERCEYTCIHVFYGMGTSYNGRHTHMCNVLIVIRVRGIIIMVI